MENIPFRAQFGDTEIRNTNPEVRMREIIIHSALIISGFIFSVCAYAEPSKIQETGEFRGDLEHTVYSNLCGDIHDRVICVDGFKIFQTVVYGFCNNGGGAAVSNIQLYEDKGGKVTPATCGQTKAKQQ